MMSRHIQYLSMKPCNILFLHIATLSNPVLLLFTLHGTLLALKATSMYGMHLPCIVCRATVALLAPPKLKDLKFEVNALCTLSRVVGPCLSPATCDTFHSGHDIVFVPWHARWLYVLCHPNLSVRLQQGDVVVW